MLKLFADWATYKLLQFQPGTHAADAVNFFVYDTLKILLLLVVVIFAVSVIRTFVPPPKIKKILSRKNEYAGNILAALLGTVTPFCTCSAIPLFLGFIEAGVPLGATFSFLVASPMVNEVALALLFGMFGWKIAVIYVISGLLLAILSGVIIGKMNVEDLLENLARDGKIQENKLPEKVYWEQRFRFAKRYTFRIVKRVWIYVVAGVGIGAWIHGYVPTDLLAQYASSDKWYAVPVAVVIGIPLYSNAAGIIPLVGALTEKGVAVGTALAFMMAVTGLSLPEFLILRKVMKVKLILIFVGIVGIGILFTGYLFNAVLGR